MSKKRARGSFRRLPSGRWQVRYTGPDGLRHKLDETYRTRVEADVAFSILMGNVARGRWIDPDNSRVALNDYAERWIAERAGLADRTRELYRSLLRRHIAPYIGRVQLRHLSPDRVRAWRQDRLQSGLGVSTVAKAYRLLSAICATAVDDELLPRNPCRIKGAGSEAAAERPVLTLLEVYALADSISPRFRVLVLLAVFGSLRWGELLGLRRGDVDLETMTLHVRRSVTEVGGQLVTKGPKTTAGRRSVALPELLHAEISHHLETYAEPGIAGRVFVGQKGATPRRAHFVGIWREAKLKAGVADEVHFHDLRHTGNHFAAASGASTRELMSRMGHASMRAALIYQHATAERDRSIANAMDRLLDGASRPAPDGKEKP